MSQFLKASALAIAAAVLISAASAPQAELLATAAHLKAAEAQAVANPSPLLKTH